MEEAGRGGLMEKCPEGAWRAQGTRRSRVGGTGAQSRPRGGGSCKGR